MKKKSLALGIILSLFFGVLGFFYSSKAAAIRLFILTFIILLLIVLAFGGEGLKYPIFFLHPFVILCSAHIIKKQNDAIERNEKLSNEFEVNTSQEMIIPTMIVLFLGFGIVALIGQFNSSNILVNNFSALTFMTSILAIVYFLLPTRK